MSFAQVCYFYTVDTMLDRLGPADAHEKLGLGPSWRAKLLMILHSPFKVFSQNLIEHNTYSGFPLFGVIVTKGSMTPVKGF